MAVLPEAVVEIAPSSEHSPLVSRQWIFAAAVLGLIIGLVAIIAITLAYKSCAAMGAADGTHRAGESGQPGGDQ